MPKRLAKNNELVAEIKIMMTTFTVIYSWGIMPELIVLTLKDRPILTVLLILAGFFEAFSAGMNNVANAVGPLVGAGMMDVTTGIVLGGALLFFTHRTHQTNNP